MTQHDHIMLIAKRCREYRDALNGMAEDAVSLRDFQERMMLLVGALTLQELAEFWLAHNAPPGSNRPI